MSSTTKTIFILLGIMSFGAESQIQAQDTLSSSESVRQKIQHPCNSCVPPRFMILGDKPNSPPGYSPAGMLSSSDLWTTKIPSPNPRVDFAVGGEEGKFYILGGKNPTNSFLYGIIEEFDPATGTWSPKANMPTPRENLGAATLNGRIYAIGGFANSSHQNVCEEYDISMDSWSSKTPMNIARQKPIVVAEGDKIYVIGGDQTVQKTIEEFDPNSNTWTQKTPPSNFYSAWTMVAGATAGGKIYIWGTFSIFNQGLTQPGAWTYDIQSDSWTGPSAPLEEPFGNFDATEFNGLIFLTGWSSNSSWVKAYDPATNTFNSKATLASSVIDPRIISSEDRIYCFGWNSGTQSTDSQEYSPSKNYYLFRKN